MNPTELRPLFLWAEQTRPVTPVHLFCASSVTAAVVALRAQLNGRISYATKANAHPFMLAALRPLIDEFNVTNPAHLGSVLSAGIAPKRITYINPVTSPRAARDALAAGVNRFVVDDERGVDVLAALDSPVRLTLRLRPSGAGPGGRAMVRFGNTAEALRRVAARAVAAGASIEALSFSFFVGPPAEQRGAETPYALTLAELAKLHRDLASDGIEVTAVNIGGGFPGARRLFYRRYPDFFARISDEIGAVFPDGTTVICEPGRFLSEPSMAMLSRVVVDRAIAGVRTTHLDASGYAGLFETTFIEPGGAALPVATARAGQPTQTQLLGPVMDSFDVIKRDAVLPPLRDGDLLLFPNTGAYSWGYAATCEGVRQPDVIPLPAELQPCLGELWTE